MVVHGEEEEKGAEKEDCKSVSTNENVAFDHFLLIPNPKE